MLSQPDNHPDAQWAVIATHYAEGLCLMSVCQRTFKGWASRLIISSDTRIQSATQSLPRRTVPNNITSSCRGTLYSLTNKSCSYQIVFADASARHHKFENLSPAQNLNPSRTIHG